MIPLGTLPPPVVETPLEAAPQADQAPCDPFDTSHLANGLKGRSVRGGFITVIAQGLRFAIRMVSTIAMSRMLTPGDFGLIAMVAALTGFAVIFRDLGLSMATIQRKSVTHRQISNLFWINVAVSLLVAGVIVALAPAIGWFYSDARLTPVARVLALAFVFGGLGVQHQALLRRQMRFMALGLAAIAGMAAGVAAAIVSAAYGAGYWSLVVMALVTEAVVTLFNALSCRWRPGWPRRQCGTWDMLRFGGHMTGFSVVNYFARNLDNVLVGRFLGTLAVGYYSKAYSIMMLPIAQIRDPLNAVAIPALSQMQNHPQRYRNYYVYMVELLAFASMPVTLYLFVMAPEVIRVILGPQWSASVPIFRALCLAAFIQPVASTLGLVLLTLGESKSFFRFGVANSLVMALSFAIGLPWGAVGVGLSYAAANYLVLYPSLLYCFKNTPMQAKDFFKAVSKPAVPAAAMAALLYAIKPAFAGMPPVAGVAALFVVSIGLYVGFWTLTAPGRDYLKQILQFKNALSCHA